MKVIHLIDNAGAGGAQVMVKSFLNHNSSSTGMAIRKLDFQPNFHEKLAINPSKSFFSLKRLFWLKQVFSTENKSVIHVHLNNSVFHIVVLILFFRLKNPIVIHEHGEIQKSNITGKALRFCYKALKQKVKFIAVSEDVKKALFNCNINLSQISLIPNVAFRSFEGRKQNNPFVLGFCGRIEPRKNWEFFVDLAKSFSNNSAVKFLIAGNGPEEVKLTETIKKLGLNNIQFLGYVSDIDRFYNQINCLVIPSFWEGHSLVQLEALSSNIPVISFSGKGMNSKNKNHYVLSSNTLLACKAEVESLIQTKSPIITIEESQVLFNNQKQKFFDAVESLYLTLKSNN